VFYNRLINVKLGNSIGRGYISVAIYFTYLKAYLDWTSEMRITWERCLTIDRLPSNLTAALVEQLALLLYTWFVLKLKGGAIQSVLQSCVIPNTCLGYLSSTLFLLLFCQFTWSSSVIAALHQVQKAIAEAAADRGVEEEDKDNKYIE
jgi:hypothetical protein